MSTTPLVPEQELRIKAAIEDPVLFAKTFLGMDCWYKQAEILRAVAEPYAKVVIKSCHSSSKTCSSAIAALWFLARYTEAIVITTAPTWMQVQTVLWGEIHAQLAKSLYPFPEANQTELNFRSQGYPKRYARGVATSVQNQDEGVRFQGFHAQCVLVIMDEAPGVDPKIWEAIEGIRAGGDVRILAIGNPTISSGPFFDAFAKDRTGWKTFTISAFDTPNFEGVTLEELLRRGKEDPAWLKDNPLPYLTAKYWVYEKYHAWGPENPLYEARVLGNFPKQAQDALLNLTWLEQAKNRDLDKQCKGELFAGLDVAGPGEAETSLTVRDGPKIILHKQWSYPDPRGEVALELLPFKSKLKAFNIDIIGVGWGIYLHFKDLGFPAIPVNICETSSDPEQFADCKAEYYWGLRLRLQAGDLSGLVDEETIAQLAGIRWKPNSRGQIEIESKEQAAKRGVRSPDRAESVMLCFASQEPAVYGALEYYKQKMKELSSKKEITEETPLCPNLACRSASVTKTQGHYRCQQCGVEFLDSKQKSTTVKIPNRAEYLKSLVKRW
jgi:phage terminase large subunit